MNIQDPVADMFVRIKNAQQVEKKWVSMPASKLKTNIAKVLRSEGFIQDFQIEEAKHPILIIYLKYHQGKPVIELLERVSRVSCRVYRSFRDLRKTMNGFQVALISTSTAGVVSDRVARQLKQGGEVLGLVA